jgi:signal transduction histidine kinase
VDIGEIIEEAIELITLLADERRITIDYVDHEPRRSLVRGNRIRLKQALINLLSNAVKYNREGGTISINKQSIPGPRVQLTIGDTGAGIPPQEVARLFQPFSRIGIRDEYVPGTGIGLAISRQLVRVMGGEVKLLDTSTSGTVFAVELEAADT